MMANLKCVKTVSLGHHETVVTIAFFVLLFANPSAPQTNCEPIIFGLTVALPWDIANTLRAPIGGPVSLALSVLMALILLFSFLLAPVNYILGYPSRIYHPARRPGLISEVLYSDGFKNPLEELANVANIITNRTADEMYRNDPSEPQRFSQDLATARSLSSSTGGENYQDKPLFPDFISSAFFLIPEEDIGCRKLILCHAHGFLKLFPTRLTKFVRFFSKRLASIPEEYQSAVILGLSSQAECQKVFKCSKNISVLLKDVMYNLISTETKEFWKLQKLF